MSEENNYYNFNKSEFLQDLMSLERVLVINTPEIIKNL